MTAFLVFTENQPLLVMTSRAAVSEGRRVEGLTGKASVNYGSRSAAGTPPG